MRFETKVKLGRAYLAAALIATWLLLGVGIRYAFELINTLLLRYAP